MDAMNGLPLTHALLDGDDRDIVTQCLRAIREHLNMDIGVLSEFVDDTYVLRALDAPGLEDQLKVGDTFPLEIMYCPQVDAGNLPAVITDSRDHALAMSLPITDMVGIRSYVGLPVRRADGTVYGMFCCVSAKPNPSLNERDLEMMRIFADLASHDVNRQLRDKQAIVALNESLDAAAAPGGVEIHFQPIVGLEDMKMIGVEALSRFQVPPHQPPNVWFESAARVSRHCDLEIAVIEQALSALPDLPSHITLSLNASPDTVATGRLAEVLRRASPERLVLEVTEHAQIDDYGTLNRELDRLRTCGVRLAVDDAGSGYAGLSHIIQLRPDTIKLDLSLVRDIDRDKVRQALTVAMCHFAAEISASLIAEGIETQAELAMLRSLGVHAGQGYLLGRPQPLEMLLQGEGPASRAGAA